VSISSTLLLSKEGERLRGMLGMVVQSIIADYDIASWGVTDVLVLNSKVYAG
jgi:hypothetical protein